MDATLKLQDGTVIDLSRYPLPDGVEDGVLNRTELAVAMNVSENTITKWTSAGMPMVGEGTNGRSYEYRLSQCFAWYQHRKDVQTADQEHRNRIAHQAAMAFINLEGEETQDAGLSAKDVREISEAELIRNKVALQRGELLRASRVKPVIEDMLVAVRNSVSTFPDYLERELGLTTTQVAKVQNRCDQMLDEMRRNIGEAIQLDGEVTDLSEARQPGLGV